MENFLFCAVKRTIHRIKNILKSDCEPYICVVCSINSDSFSKTVHDWKVREHGNFKQKQSYHRTEQTILKLQDTLLSVNKHP